MNKLRLVFLLALSAVIPSIVLAGVSGQYFIHQQRQALDRTIADRAATLSAALSRELQTQMQLLGIVSESPRLDEPVDVAAFGELARRLRLRIPAWDMVRLNDAEGRLLLTVPAGSPVGSRTVVDEPSLRQLFATGKPVLGSIRKGPGGRLAFPIRAPVLRNGRVSSVLTAVIRPEAIAAVLRANGLPEGWAGFVSDARGALVGAVPASDAVGDELGRYVEREEGEGPIFEGRLTSGEDIRYAMAAIGNTDWAVHVGIPLSDYTALSAQTYGLLAVTCLLTVLLSIAAILILQRELAARRRQEEILANSQRMDALGKLTGQVAHDFNNLLMIFQAGANGIRRRREDEARVEQLIAGMLDGVARGKEMTQRLLSFSRKSNEGAKVLDPAQVLREMAPLLHQAANDTITIDMDIEAGLWPVRCDPKALEIALVNLVTNAREAMPEGGRLTIKLRNLQDGRQQMPGLDGRFVALSVSDTGAGIAPQTLRRVFEPFFTTKSPGAAGLGLTQVQRFAERSGGGATAVSVLGVGTAVTVLLPSASEERAEEDRLKRPPTLPKRVLIVDDTPATLEAAKLLFEGEAVEILTASDGVMALEVLEKDSKIEALLSDIMMPRMSGLELADLVRRRFPSIRIVLMTGYSDRLEAGAKVAHQVLRKPFTQAELHAAFAGEPAAADPSARPA